MVLVQSNDDLMHGDVASVFELKGVDNRMHSLDKYSEKKAFLIVFMCNHCPYVLPKINELKKIHEDFLDLQVIAINSNNHPDYPEDNFENMQRFAIEQSLNFPYLFDETQQVAKDYGAVCTPDPFLFDKDKKLIWKGRINNGGTNEGTVSELYEAIKEFFETGKITKEEIPSMGCSIKWKD